MRRRKRNWFNKLFWWLSGGGKGNDGEKKEKSKPSEKEKDTPKEKEEKPVEEKKTGEEIKPEEEPKKPILKPKILEEKPSKEDPPPYTPPIKHIPHVEEDPEEIEIEAHKVKEDPFSGRKILPVGIKSGKLNVPDSEVKNCSKIYLEVFNTITSMIYTLDHRNDNKVMRGLRHSYTNGYDFTGSNSYEEAREIYRKGYTKILPEVREKVKSLVVKYNNDNTNKSSINNDVVGYVPNVPNALMNLPSSMIHRKPCPRRTKTLHIIYFMEGNCGVPAGVFKKSGIVLLAAIQIIEKRKIDVMLEVGFCGGYGNTEVLGGVVKVKNYQEKLNIQKLCFPIAHPSFFRRFGFRFIETFPALEDTYFNDGYGHAMNLDSLQKCFTFKDKNAIILNAIFIHKELNSDVEKLVNYINSKCD